MVTDAQLTRCSPGNDGWSLEVRELQINEKSFAQAKGSVLGLNRFQWLIYRVCESLWTASNRLAGRYLRWCQQQGWSGVTDSYRWKVSPALDAIVMPRLVSRQGVGVDGQIRYDNQSQHAAVDLSYLASDDLYNGLFDRETYKALGGEAVLGSFDAADRGLCRSRGSLGPLQPEWILREVVTAIFSATLMPTLTREP